MTAAEAQAAAILRQCDLRRVADLTTAMVGEAVIREARPEEMAMACVGVLATQAKRAGDAGAQRGALEALVVALRQVFAAQA